VERPGVAADRSALTRLQDELAQQPGITRVIGPADLLMSRPRGVLISESGNAARYLLIYDSDPLGARAIGHVRQLESDLPQLVTNPASPMPRFRSPDRPCSPPKLPS